MRGEGRGSEKGGGGEGRGRRSWYRRPPLKPLGDSFKFNHKNPLVSPFMGRIREPNSGSAGGGGLAGGVTLGAGSEPFRGGTVPSPLPVPTPPAPPQPDPSPVPTPASSATSDPTSTPTRDPPPGPHTHVHAATSPGPPAADRGAATGPALPWPERPIECDAVADARWRVHRPTTAPTPLAARGGNLLLRFDPRPARSEAT